MFLNQSLMPKILIPACSARNFAFGIDWAANCAVKFCRAKGESCYGRPKARMITGNLIGYDPAHVVNMDYWLLIWEYFLYQHPFKSASTALYPNSWLGQHWLDHIPGPPFIRPVLWWLYRPGREASFNWPPYKFFFILWTSVGSLSLIVITATQPLGIKLEIPSVLERESENPDTPISLIKFSLQTLLHSQLPLPSSPAY
ncbi:uncharacterized protein BDR25DRAFT_355109 [Lindgomyces ingoldianus]|uniref:Uncharacterized protein n=1 Tax=Lindgomyces ingoldianus TaxID=673940 RepID=A0ACB6QUF4_9PLEO|nr:uncharacterized protein BDR25DRAFT_355109 [Lindgomyces ingoldianus]KAF2470623.1 hypothetical protein BDR25DRAFT_355109 [Lindgomyces ingoldianus]